jgi:hypothetical protein
LKVQLGSLESLVEQHAKNGADEDSFPVTYKIFRRIYGNLVDVKAIFRKGVFPYEWLDEYNKLESTGLPPIECWTSKLTAMCSYLFQDIIGDVEYVKEEDSDRVLNEILSLPDEGDLGAKVVVDMIYPKHLHKLHNAYPLAPIRKKFKDGEKLVQTLEDRIKYSY